MDPPVSEDEDDESVYSSPVMQDEVADVVPDPVVGADKAAAAAPAAAPAIGSDHGDVSTRSPSADVSSAGTGNSASATAIRDEDIKIKVPLSTSMMLTKLDHNTNDIIDKFTHPKVEKLTVRFQPIGSVDQIQPKVFKISSTQQFQTLVKFLNKKLARKLSKDNPNELFGGHVFCYLHNSFTPGPEEIIGNLFEVSIAVQPATPATPAPSPPLTHLLTPLRSISPSTTNSSCPTVTPSPSDRVFIVPLRQNNKRLSKK